MNLQKIVEKLTDKQYKEARPLILWDDKKQLWYKCTIDHILSAFKKQGMNKQDIRDLVHEAQDLALEIKAKDPYLKGITKATEKLIDKYKEEK